MNPFNIGPWGAILLTLFIAVIVLLCVVNVNNATIIVTRIICNTVEKMWDTIASIVDNVMKSKQP